MRKWSQYFDETLFQMKNIVEPKTIAIVGASSKIEKVGGAVTRNALEEDYHGKIYLVNPNARKILGRKVYPSLEEIPDSIDLVVIIVPASLVPTIMEQAVLKGAKGAIIISSGFTETGRNDLQDKVVKIGKMGGMRIIGPNCFGIINTYIDMDTSFTFTKPLKGSISFVSQSGAMCCGTLDWAYKKEIGFSKFINLGNKCDIDEADAILYLGEDSKTKVIAVHTEGVTDGRKLFDVVKIVSKKKPIIILKAGTTEPGAKAALSHTGSIAGASNIFKAALKQAGAILVEDVEELFDSIQVFSQPLSQGRNVAIISNAGGLGVLTADWCDRLGLSIPNLLSKTLEKLRAFLPPIASSFNPVDMTGNADYECYRRVLEIISEAGNIDIIISIFVSQGLVTSDGPARAVVDVKKKCMKPILAYLMGGNSIFNGVKILNRGEVPVFSSPERVAKAALKLTLQPNLRARN